MLGRCRRTCHTHLLIAVGKAQEKQSRRSNPKNFCAKNIRGKNAKSRNKVINSWKMMVLRVVVPCDECSSGHRPRGAFRFGPHIVPARYATAHARTIRAHHEASPRASHRRAHNSRKRNAASDTPPCARGQKKTGERGLRSPFLILRRGCGTATCARPSRCSPGLVFCSGFRVVARACLLLEGSDPHAIERGVFVQPEQVYAAGLVDARRVGRSAATREIDRCGHGVAS